MTFHPWRALSLLTHIDLQWEARPNILGTFELATNVITLHPRQSQAQRRCTLAHELIHAERADVECDQRTDDLVHQEAARRLITIQALADAVVFHADDLEALAEELWVDLETLQARLDHLHPSERGLLRRRMATQERSA